jgi:hypothetical protein
MLAAAKALFDWAIGMILVDHVISGILAIVAAAPTGIWVGRWALTQKQRPKVLSTVVYGLIGIGVLCFAALAVIAVVSLREQATVAATPAAPTPAPKANPTPSERRSILAASRFYSRADREQVADALSAIEAAYKYPGMDVSRETQEIVQPVGSVPWDQLDILIERMTGQKAKAQKIETDMGEARQRYINFHSEIDLLTMNRHLLSQFIRGIEQFTNVMRAYRRFAPEARDNDGNNLGAVLMGAREDFNRSKHGFQQWMQELDRGIEATRAELKQ